MFIEAKVFQCKEMIIETKIVRLMVNRMFRNRILKAKVVVDNNN
jgi:hypothetical protein